MDIAYTPGASNVNYLVATYAQLVAAFGDGTLEPRDDYKQMAQWRINTVHGMVDLYDYKTGTCYLGADGQELEDITEWHVQGSEKAIEVMLARLRLAVLEMPDEPVKAAPTPTIDDLLRGYRDPGSYEGAEDGPAMRVATALEIAWKSGGGDEEAHHLAWVIDQMVRALVDENDYATFVHLATHDEDGELAYEWSEGIAP